MALSLGRATGLAAATTGLSQDDGAGRWAIAGSSCSMVNIQTKETMLRNSDV
jgi:hypothetical protein